MSTGLPDTPVRIALLGAGGRMGQAVLAAAADFPGVCVSTALTHGQHNLSNLLSDGVGSAQDLQQALARSDVLVDFSAPPATVAAASACAAAGKPMVTGVTGLGADAHADLVRASRKIALLAAPNMSLGANLLIALTGVAAAALGAEFDIEITDIHHRGKRDAPSGTALAVGEAAAAARGQRLAEQAAFARHGQSSARRPGSIGFASLRAGEIAGEHRVLFAGPAESLELTHRVASRAAFARGALVAARWIVDQPAGLYGMNDMLNLHI